VAGADAVQIYSSFIFRGPGVIRDIVRGLETRVRERGCTTLTEAVAAARAA
jgi:dihydroorotate dehydrogenase